MKFLPLILIAGLTGLSLPSTAAASPEKGLEIATELDKRDTGFKDSTSTMVMVLSDQHGQSTQRAIRNQTLEGSSEGDLSLVIFDSPGDVRGTAFLSHTKKAGSDDQWLFLPALKRVKRIASSNKAGPFMGSEFAYEDISSQEIEKYTYNYLRDEKVNGLDCFLVEYDPVDRKSGYSRQLVWIDKKEYRLQKIEFYDRKNSLLKTLSYADYNKFLGKYWRADTLSMENHQTGKKTQLQFSDWAFQTGMTEKDFQKNALKRIK
mgnify:FL=1